jgi:hypothetical protein
MNTTLTSHEMQLSGLREDNPRDFLAALGLLRVVDLIWPETAASLSWDIVRGIPVLCLSHALPDSWGEQIWQQFLDWRDSPSKPFGHGKIEAINPEQFRKILLDESLIEPNLAWFYTSLSSQLSHEKTGKRSEFIIESASKSVLTGILGILDQSRRNRPDVKADLMGTSERQKVKNTSRWHPGEFQAAAYMAADPEDSVFVDYITLNIFALIGLSFYPVVDSVRGRRTPGMVPERGQKIRFSWPIWEHPIPASCLPSILHDSCIHGEENDASLLQARGITRVWRSRRFKANGDNQYFSKAEPMF